MAQKLTEEDGRLALAGHIADKAEAARASYGGAIDWPTLLEMLGDAAVVRYPTDVAFDAAPLEAGEFAFAAPLGASPGDGFRIYVHPWFEGRTDVLPLLVAYHIVRINYGDIATHHDAELFGATLLGLEPDDYYETLCTLADEVGGDPATLV